MILSAILEIVSAAVVRQAVPDDFAIWAVTGGGSGHRAMPSGQPEVVVLDRLRYAAISPLEGRNDLSDRQPGVLGTESLVRDHPMLVEHFEDVLGVAGSVEGGADYI
jgi:hypothetical protein